jgi:hypothetical protein
MKKLLFIAFLFLVLTQTATVKAQDLLKGQYLSTLKVDNLSDADLVKLRSQLQSNSMTIDQAEAIAIAKGMPASEFAKLKARLGTPMAASTKKGNATESTEILGRTQEPIVNTKSKDEVNALVFGSELQALDFPVVVPNFQIHTHNKQTFVAAPEVSILQHDKAMKLLLWNCLKSIFNV